MLNYSYTDNLLPLITSFNQVWTLVRMPMVYTQLDALGTAVFYRKDFLLGWYFVAGGLLFPQVREILCVTHTCSHVC